MSDRDVISLTKFRARFDRAKWRRKYLLYKTALGMGATDEQALQTVYDSEAHDAAQLRTPHRVWRLIGWVVLCITIWAIGSLLIVAYMP